MAQQLFDLALGLLAYCNDKNNFDQKIFNNKLKEFDRLYRRANNTIQGEYHDLWFKINH